MLEHYSFRDYWRKRGDKSVEKTWKRISERRLKEIIHPDLDCFATIQAFASPTQVDGEPHLVPLFWDLDGDLDQAREDAVKIVRFFTILGVERPHVRVWFSGKKGFHITVEPATFIDATLTEAPEGEPEPSPDLTAIVALAARFVSEVTECRTFDVSVYSGGKGRVLRLENSRHSGTGLYKVELSDADLAKGIEHIRAFAAQPRASPLYPPEEYERITPVLKEWFMRFIREREAHRVNLNLTPRKPGFKPDAPTDRMPSCMNDLLANSIRIKGTRNAGAMAVAAYCADAAMPIEQAVGIIRKWALEIPPDLTDTPPEQRAAQAVSVLRTVYRSQTPENKTGKVYHHICNQIRSIGTGKRDIHCDWEECPFVNAIDQEPAAPIALPLAESAEACYNGKRIQIELTVVGKVSSPYSIPASGHILCHPELDSDSVCVTRCGLLQHKGKTPVSFDTTKPDTLLMVGATTGGLQNIVRGAARVPKNCPDKQVRFEPATLMSVHRISVVPYYDPAKAVMGRFDYVHRDAFLIGDAPPENKGMRCLGYTWPSPLTQMATHFFDSVEVMHDFHDKFEMTREQSERLRMLYQGPPEEVFKRVHDDLEPNVYRVWGRRDMAIAFDIVFHSANSYTFQNKLEHRGFVQALIVGDTNQAKTDLTRRLMLHYGLGERVSGESAGRAGLTYAILKLSDKFYIKWGRLAAADRRALVIDEMQKLDKEELGNLGDAREEGEIIVNRSVTGRALSRVRLLCLANPGDGRPVAKYAYGCQALLSLFKGDKDLRRFDFAMTVASGEVPRAVLNSPDHPDPDVSAYSPADCRALLMWAWTRRAEQVVFAEDSTQTVLRCTETLLDKFGASLALVEPGDFRLKLARMAAAVAIRCYSTPDGVSVHVTPEHVSFITDYLDRVYSKDMFNLDRLSKNEARRRDLTPSKEVAVRDWLRFLPDKARLLDTLLDSDGRFTLTDLSEGWGREKQETKPAITFLREMGLIEKTYTFYRNTALGIGLFKVLTAEMEHDGAKSDGTGAGSGPQAHGHLQDAGSGRAMGDLPV